MGSFEGKTMDITTEHVLNFLSNLYDKSVSKAAIVIAKYVLATRMTMTLYRSLNDYRLIFKVFSRVFNI